MLPIFPEAELPNDTTDKSTIGKPVELPKATAQTVPLAKSSGADESAAAAFPSSTPGPTTTIGKRKRIQLERMMLRKGWHGAH